jgi:GYF domain/WW domain binding protein 11/mRNA biogenesis factor
LIWLYFISFVVQRYQSESRTTTQVFFFSSLREQEEGGASTVLMSKNSGGVADWHKKQHKKQLAKNKEARIAARDERVVLEKTVQDVRAEIRKLEQQYKNEELRPHPIQSKLDRLKKELKLVTAKEAADKQNRERTLQQQKVIPKPDSYVPLERPEVSVYFDAVMNPFGAPPPGQPKLYYQRGGGTTMNLNKACTPQEQFLPPPPPPPPRPAFPVNAPILQRPPPTRGPPPQNSHQSRSIPGKDSRKLGLEESNIVHALSATSTSKPGKAIVDPSQLPSLPAPSTAVARIKQNRLAVDIWASQEEIDYEQQVSATSLEGLGALATVPSVWYYKDISGALQGPFTTEQIRQWNKAGYFPENTPVCGTSLSGPWSPLSEIKLLNDVGKKGPPDSSSVTRSTSSVQERIAALRRNIAASHQSVGISPEAISSLEGDASPRMDEEDSIRSRIVALKAQNLSKDIVVEQCRDQDQNVDTGYDPLHVMLTSGGVNDEQENGVFSNANQEIHDNDGDDSLKLVSVEDRIAALRAQHLKTAAKDEVGQLSFHQNGDIGISSLPLPPPPPPKAENSPEDIPLYPLDDIIAAYPIDYVRNEVGDQLVSYSLDDHEHPVTDDYVDGNNEYPIGPSESYPVTDPYGGDSKEMLQPPKKKVKVDQAVRALVPSRLLKR